MTSASRDKLHAVCSFSKEDFFVVVVVVIVANVASFSGDPNYRAGSRCFQVVTFTSFESFQQVMPHFLPAPTDYSDQRARLVCVGGAVHDECCTSCSAAVQHAARTHSHTRACFM